LPDDRVERRNRAEDFAPATLDHGPAAIKASAEGYKFQQRAHSCKHSGNTAELYLCRWMDHPILFG
jgi:hypothetical protein